MPGQPAPLSVAPYTPPSPQSQLLAQVLQQMRAQPQTPVGATANLVAAALNTFGQQAAGQGGAGQWRDAAGNASGNWFNSPLGKSVGGLFGLGLAANPQGQVGYGVGPSGVAPDGYTGASANWAPVE
jgi:hypothetical protein